ncbi:hypothetical protein SESBI_05274 [Sesbania bispinosa]|nr:hypothetical protein SESBI_05274 [Sesbania bispinosa]
MASGKCFITAFLLALTFSSMSFSLAARHLLQTTTPTLPKPTLPPLPSIPTLPQGNVNLPPLPATSLPNFPSIPFPTTMPSIPFLSPPPSTSSTP